MLTNTQMEFRHPHHPPIKKKLQHTASINNTHTHTKAEMLTCDESCIEISYFPCTKTYSLLIVLMYKQKIVCERQRSVTYLIFSWCTCCHVFSPLTWPARSGLHAANNRCRRSYFDTFQFYFTSSWRMVGVLQKWKWESRQKNLKLKSLQSVIRNSNTRTNWTKWF